MMRKFLFVMLCVMLAYNAYADDTDAEAVAEYTYGVDAFEVGYADRIWMFRGNDNQSITGIVNRYYESGKLYETINVRRGNIIGDRIVYYEESGNIKAVTPYEESRSNGVAKQFYESGNLKAEITFEKGKRVSSKEYHDNDDGEMTEIQYSNELFESETAWKDDKRIDYKHYDLMNGHLDAQGFYADGELVKMIEYHYNGKEKRITQYADGKKNGLMQTFDRYGNGILFLENNYKDDLLHGIQKQYGQFPHGFSDVTLVVWSMQDDVEHGTETYYIDTKVYLEIEYDMGTAISANCGDKFGNKIPVSRVIVHNFNVDQNASISCREYWSADYKGQ
jgi:antitoxin component YwqK of YwqJK toxin-antitoxin module